MSDPRASNPLVAVSDWVAQTIVGQDLCPFARQPWQRGLVNIVSATTQSSDELLAELQRHAQELDDAGEGTTLVVLGAPPDGHVIEILDFPEFLALAYQVEDALSAAGFDRRVQIVAFHPDYVFDGAPADDPANGVNRSPWPLFHLLRWADVHDAISSHPDIGSVSRRNSALLREQAGWDPPG